MLLCTLYFSAVEQQLGFEHRDLGFRVGDRVVEDHLDRLVQRDLLHVDQLSLVGTALALLRDPAGIEVDDLVGIARGGISLTEFSSSSAAIHTPPGWRTISRMEEEPSGRTTSSWNICSTRP